MTRNDGILAGAIVLMAFVIFLLNFNSGSKSDGRVVVWVDEERYGEYELQEDQHISIRDTNVLVIEDGKAWMETADCPDQICVHQRAIDKDEESIICLPNKIVVVIESNKESSLDAVSQ